MLGENQISRPSNSQRSGQPWCDTNVEMGGRGVVTCRRGNTPSFLCCIRAKVVESETRILPLEMEEDGFSEHG